MIDAIFEGLIESIEKFRFQLNLRFDLENSDGFLAVQRLWNMALENPLILLGAIVILLGIPIGLYQSRKAQAGREKRMDRLMGDLETDAAAKPLFENQMQPPQDDGEADFISLNSFLVKDFSNPQMSGLEAGSAGGEQNPQQWDMDDLYPSSTPLNKDFGGLEEPPSLDEAMDLEPSTNGARALHLDENDAADGVAGAGEDGDTLDLTSADLEPQETTANELDDIFEYTASGSENAEIDLSAEIEEAISEIEGTLDEIQHRGAPETAAAEAPSEDLIDLETPEEADIETVDEEIAWEPEVASGTAEPALALEEETLLEEPLKEEALETSSLEPEFTPAATPRETGTATAAQDTAAEAKPARNSRDLMDRLLKFQEKLEKRMADLGSEGGENGSTVAKPALSQEKKILEPVNMRNPEENTDPKAKNYQQLLESYFLTNKQNKGE